VLAVTVVVLKVLVLALQFLCCKIFVLAFIVFFCCKVFVLALIVVLKVLYLL
jgi:hypothetical protein